MRFFVLLAACLVTVLASLSPVPFSKEDIVTAAKFSDQQLCYIRLYGVGLSDENGNRAYGLKYSFDVETIALMAEPDYTGIIGGEDIFFEVVNLSDLHEYSTTEDYCGELERLLTRKAEIKKEIYEKWQADQLEIS